VDVDAQTANMDPVRLQAYLERDCTRGASGRLISRRRGGPVAAIVPVHLYGQTADLDPVMTLAERHQLLVVEDACQAHGAEYYSTSGRRWRKAGSIGHAAAFSFYPGKNLGACGEAGAVTTHDPEIAARVRMLRDHGQVRKYYHDVEGYNGRLDALQAGILHAKLACLAAWNAQRQKLAAAYDEALTPLGVTRIARMSWARAVHHLYVIQVAERDAFIRHMNEAEIGTGIHYPIPLHLQNACRRLNYKRGDFPVSERLAESVVSLPMYPHLSREQLLRVVDEIRQFLAQ
jgi:dTDP-4-amino-4,6-dideoxygalactose transaminase